MVCFSCCSQYQASLTRTHSYAVYRKKNEVFFQALCSPAWKLHCISLVIEPLQMSWAQTAWGGMESLLPGALSCLWCAESSGLCGNAVVEGAAPHIISKSQSITQAHWQSLTRIPKHTTAWFVSSSTPQATQQWLAACLLQQQMDNLANVQITKCHFKKREREREREKVREQQRKHAREETKIPNNSCDTTTMHIQTHH